MGARNLFSSFCGLLFILSGATSHRIDGKVIPPERDNKKWVKDLQILVDGGKWKGFLRDDDTFTIHDMAPESYVVEVFSPKYKFQSVRVDITSKGKKRAREVNNLDSRQVKLTKYPLEIKPVERTHYFEVRKKYGVIDMIKDPAVLMLVLPMLMFALLYKMTSTDDPAIRSQLEQSMGMFQRPSDQNENLFNSIFSFDLAEFMANLFHSGSHAPRYTSKKITRSSSKKKKTASSASENTENISHISSKSVREGSVSLSASKNIRKKRKRQ